ncbi:MAG TPA: cation transporter [Bacteroidetes bacterium]|nr:MAG: cation transporter [Bacteroidota bacterium]RLD83585.1 MAG: cation transporter [Bacteroidota bacterium]HHJ10944.1 cation transporter [Bacteroidota bacterium]
MGHHHHHKHSEQGRKLLITVLLNLVITLVEFVGGIFSNSLALISDAFHNLSDTVAILIAYITERVSRRASDKQHTFGYKRIQILAALFNAVTLIAISVYLIFEAWDRYQNPQPIKSLLMLSVALIGLLANLLSVLLLKSYRKENLNIKAAYLHLIGDTLSSVAVIIGGVLIYFYEWYWIDPLITVLISLYIIKETYVVLYDTYKILMQQTPSGINVNEIVAGITEYREIKGVHHIHIWNLTDTEVHFEAHIDLFKDLKVSESQKVVDKIQVLLKERFNIDHVTLQLEYDRCDDKELIHQERK